MIGACPVTPTGGAFLSGMLAHLDCQAQTIGAAGYQALASPGSPTSIALTSLLTIFIALFGLRMLLGHTPDARDAVVAAMKMGSVLVLASSWGAYRTIAYDLVLRGPAEVAGAIGQASALPGAEGGLTGRLQNVDDLILYFAGVGSGQPLLSERADLTPVERARVAPPLVSDSFAFGMARTSFLVTTIGSLALVRLGAGILLALAPLFAGLLLFDATRSLFFGWLRALIALALGALAVMLILGVELAIAEPWLDDALARRAATFATPAAPSELLAMTLIFGVTIIAVLAILGRLAFSLHVAIPRMEDVTRPVKERWQTTAGTLASVWATPQAEPRSRATLVSDAVARADRREEHMASAGAAGSSSTSRSYIGGTSAEHPPTAQAPIGRQFRRARPRISAGARRRDR